MAYLAIPDDFDKRLTTLAEKVQIPKNDYAVQLLEKIIEDKEDYLAALAVMERVERGEEKTLSLEEVLKELDLEKKDLCYEKTNA